MIEVRNLKKQFNGTPVLKGISTTFEKGKTSMIIGQSGSGKTVFLKCLLGLHTPDGGIISFDGRKHTELSIKEHRQLRQEIGMVFQGGALYDSLTIEENIMFPLKMFTNQRFEQMLTAGGLEEARTVHARGYPVRAPMLKAIGLSHLLSYLDGECDLENAIETAKRDTRRLAKRQMTWFRNRCADWTVLKDEAEKEIYAQSL